MLLEDLTADPHAPLQRASERASRTRPSVVPARPRVSVMPGTKRRVDHAATLTHRPSPPQQWRAAARVRLALLAAVAPSTDDALSDPFGLQRLICDVDLRRHADAAIETAGRLLGMAGRDDVIHALRRITLEHAAIEALREALLHHLQGCVRRTLGAGDHRRGRIASVALARAVAAFAEMDALVQAQLDDVLATLATANSQAQGLRWMIERAERDSAAIEELVGVGLADLGAVRGGERGSEGVR